MWEEAGCRRQQRACASFAAPQDSLFCNSFFEVGGSGGRPLESFGDDRCVYAGVAAYDMKNSDHIEILKRALDGRKLDPFQVGANLEDEPADSESVGRLD